MDQKNVDKFFSKMAKWPLTYETYTPSLIIKKMYIKVTSKTSTHIHQNDKKRVRKYRVVRYGASGTFIKSKLV